MKDLNIFELQTINGGDTPYCNGNSAGEAVREFINDVGDAISDAWDTVTGWF